MIHPDWSKSFAEASDDLIALNDTMRIYTDWLEERGRHDLVTFLRGGYPVLPKDMRLWAKETLLKICRVPDYADFHNNVKLYFQGGYLNGITCPIKSWNITIEGMINKQTLIESVCLYGDWNEKQLNSAKKYEKKGFSVKESDNGPAFIVINKKHKSILQEIIDES